MPSVKKMPPLEIQTWMNTIRLQVELIDFLDYQISAVKASVSLSASQGPPIPHTEPLPLTLFGTGQARAALACTVSLTVATNWLAIYCILSISNNCVFYGWDMLRNATHCSLPASKVQYLLDCLLCPTARLCAIASLSWKLTPWSNIY